MNALQHGQRGMTLIELVVATTLVALLMAMVYGGLRVAIRASDAASERSDALNDVRVAQQLLRRQLRAALPVRGHAPGAAGELARVFDGSRERMRFVGPMPGHLGGGVHVQEIWLEGQPGDQRLMFSHRLAHPDSQGMTMENAEPPVLLIDGLTDAQFSYLDLEPGNAQSPQWRHEWEPPARFPTLVRLQAGRADGRVVPWPTLTVAPQVTHARWSASVDTGG